MKKNINITIKENIKKEIKNLDLFTKEIIEITKTKLSKNAVKNKIIKIIKENENTTLHKNQIIYLNENNLSFRIFISNIELKNSSIILPAYKHFLTNEDITFVDEKNNKIPQIKDGLSIPYEKALPFLILFPMDKLLKTFKFDKDKIILPALSLQNFNNLKENDSFICQKIDENIFQLKIESDKNLKKMSKKLFENGDQIINFICEFIKESKEPPPLLLLAKKYKIISQIFQIKPIPFYYLISSNENTEFIELENYKSIKINSQKINDKIKYNNIKNMEQLLKLMDINLTKNYIKAKMISNLYKKNDVDVENVLSYLFPEDYYPFKGNQETLFKKLFEEIMESTLQIYFRKSLKQNNIDFFNDVLETFENLASLQYQIQKMSYFMFFADDEIYENIIKINETLDSFLEIGLNTDSTEEKISESQKILEKIKQLIKKFKISLKGEM